MTGLGLDMLPSADTEGKLEGVDAWGGYLGAQYNFTRNLFSTLAYSLVRTHASDTEAMPDRYKEAQYVVANVMWRVMPNMQVGLEYLWGDRVNADGTAYDNNRMQTMIQVNF